MQACNFRDDANARDDLSNNIYQRGVYSNEFANIKSKGDIALFGGVRTMEMMKKHKISQI